MDVFYDVSLSLTFVEGSFPWTPKQNKTGMFDRRDKGVKNGNSGLIRGHVSCPVIIGVVIADAHYK